MRLPTADHIRLREMVEAAVRAACNDHPEYLAKPGFAAYLGKSVAKRFIGMVKSSVERGARGGNGPR